MPLEFVQLRAGVEVPDDNGGVRGAREQDGAVGDGGGEQAFDKVAVAGEGLRLPGLEVGAVDVLVPAAREHALAVGGEGETC